MISRSSINGLTLAAELFSSASHSHRAPLERDPQTEGNRFDRSSFPAFVRFAPRDGHGHRCSHYTYRGTSVCTLS
ncbi:hypothetical protein IQ06DRAFT_87526 [Phaeosphaeriaceae sp. SRC1lsM3a]|nr:hypothetical protein IQ06DRAFT_87526 [Stagonospora sp. SRC1lsM3a]